MISFKTAKIFALLFLIFCSSCQYFQGKKEKKTPVSTENITLKLPFSNKDPEKFQTDVVVSSFVNNQKIERRYFVAKNGEKSLTTFGIGEKNETSVLRNSNRVYLINHSDKTFAEKSLSWTAKGSADWKKFLTTKWLNEKKQAGFKKIGKEDDLTKYSVKLEDSTNSEIIIFIDENLNIPVKQEFYTVSKDEKHLTFSVELKNFKTGTDDALFELNPDYKNAAPE